MFIIMLEKYQRKNHPNLKTIRIYDIFKNKLYIENIITIIDVSEINMVYEKQFKYVNKFPKNFT